MENDKMSYIVAYNSTSAEIRQLLEDREFCNRRMLDEFLRASAIHGSNRDDIVPWNTQFWGIVDADSAADAMFQFVNKLIVYQDKRRHLREEDRDESQVDDV